MEPGSDCFYNQHFAGSPCSLCYYSRYCTTAEKTSIFVDWFLHYDHYTDAAGYIRWVEPFGARNSIFGQHDEMILEQLPRYLNENEIKFDFKSISQKAQRITWVVYDKVLYLASISKKNNVKKRLIARKQRVYTPYEYAVLMEPQNLPLFLCDSSIAGWQKWDFSDPLEPTYQFVDNDGEVLTKDCFLDSLKQFCLNAERWSESKENMNPDDDCVKK